MQREEIVIDAAMLAVIFRGAINTAAAGVPDSQKDHAVIWAMRQAREAGRSRLVIFER